VAGDSPLELKPPGAEADVDLGVEGVQPEEVAVWAVTARRCANASLLSLNSVTDRA
jgi:hypothetical protein